MDFQKKFFLLNILQKKEGGGCLDLGKF